MAPNKGTGTGYTSKSGTSMATPLMAGIVALTLEANPDMTPGEVKETLVAGYSIEREILNDDPDAASNNWQSFDPGRREKSMDSLARSAVPRNQPSTARLEERLWHCILGPDWRSDLASQITRASEFWDNMPPIDAASELADLLLSKGTI